MKYTFKLIELLKKQENPKLMLKFIYLHVYELMRETHCENLEQMNTLIYLKHVYDVYFFKTILPSDLWLETIFPNDIYGFKNFYRGIAGRLAFFSVDLDEVIEDLKVADEKLKYALLSQTSDTYYWYGNPGNWAYCYDPKLVQSKTDSNGGTLYEISKKFFVLENEFNTYEEMREGNTNDLDITQMLILYKTVINYDQRTTPYPYPTRRYHISDEETVEKMIASYEKNTEGKRGCNHVLSGFLLSNYAKADKEKIAKRAQFRSDKIKPLEEAEKENSFLSSVFTLEFFKNHLKGNKYLKEPIE